MATTRRAALAQTTLLQPDVPVIASTSRPLPLTGTFGDGPRYAYAIATPGRVGVRPDDIDPHDCGSPVSGYLKVGPHVVWRGARG